MTGPPFQLAPIFGVRPAGAAFDVLERLGTPQIAEAARSVSAREAEAAHAAKDAMRRLVEAVPVQAERAKLERRIAQRAEVAAKHLATHPWLATYDAAARAWREAAAALDAAIEAAYRQLHGVLVREAAHELPDFLVFESESLADELDRIAVLDEPLDAVRSRDRKKDRALALYLQRVCAKNDTVSRFGPLAWGTIVDGDGVQIRPRPGVARRRVELERWVVKGLIDLLNAEPDARAEVCPRLHPHGRFDGTGFVRVDEDRAIALTADERAAAAGCDGATPAHQLADAGTLERLRDAGVIRWELELMARDASPLATLQADVEGWRPSELRERWRARLATLAALVQQFATDPAAPARRQVLRELRAHLEGIEVAVPASRRSLYAAHNPINENCEQVGQFTMGARSVDAMVAEVWPWFQLFSDAVNLAATHAYHRIHALIATAPRRGGTLDYATLVRVARAHGTGIDDDTLHARVGTETFAEIKRAFTELLGARADAREWVLTAHDCGLLRRGHAFATHGELSSPSADLQIAARSAEDAAAGRLQWIVAELHFPLVLVQHASYWSCPDKPALHAALASSVGAHAFCARDAGNAAPVHVNSEGIMAAMPRTTYVGGARTKPGWHVVRPADAEVVVDEERCDVRLRSPAGDDLGSIVRVPRLLVGMHPFFPFERGPHEPRLRVGDVIVQREAWHVRSAAIGDDRPHGVSARFVAGLERERAHRGIPRWVFIRPAPGVLPPGALVRDKDAKPMYVDLESVVFLDILERRLRKYGTLVFTEMLPTPDQLVWHQPEGRFTFEIRTNAVRVR